MVDDVEAQVAFLRSVFDATGDVAAGRPAEIRIGDSLVMVTPATERELFPAFLYVYVADADESYSRAVAAGATTLEEPRDAPYGDRRAMVRDPFGNLFQIAHQLRRPSLDDGLERIGGRRGGRVGLAQAATDVADERTRRMNMETVYESAGGAHGLLRLASAWHARVMADPVVSHAFSHGFHPEHTQRLAAYWAEALGGPATYSDSYGDETSVLRMHSGNGPHSEMDRQAIACFDQALADVGLANDDLLGQTLHDYFAWATTTTMSRFHRSADDVPDGLLIPQWSWQGLVPGHPPAASTPDG